MSVVVVGAGHNGLIAALRLARAGRKVTVVERSDRVGGLAAHDLLPHTAHVAPEVLADLGVTVPWAPAPKVAGVRADGTRFDRDGDAGWQAWCDWVAGYRAFARDVLLRAAPRLRTDAPIWPIARSGLGLRRLGSDRMNELLRVAPACAEDALTEHVHDPAVRAIAMGTGLLGTWMGPLSPTGAAILLLDRVLSGQQVSGGGPALVAALEGACRAKGVTLRTGATVARIRLTHERAHGVELADGESIDADAVVAACDPRTALLSLVDPQELPVRMGYQAAEHRVRGLVAVVRLELRRPIDVKGGPVELVHTATHPHEVERAFDAGKNRKLPASAPALARSEDGGRRLTVWVSGIAQQLGSAGIHDAVAGLALDALSRLDPGIRDAVGRREVLTPADLERDHGLAGGHLWHGELALDQLWSLRPGLDLSGHRTPIPGLFLASSGTAPAGGLTGIPGWLAAGAVLETR